MKKIWKKAITELENEIPGDVFQSLMQITLPKDTKQNQSFKINIDNKSLSSKLNPEVRNKIEKNLQMHSARIIKLNWNTTNPKETIINQSLHRDLTLETFISSSSNKLAYMATEAIALQPGKSNPFFIYGRPGNGKTHLLQGMLHLLIKHNSYSRIYYSSFEDLQDEILQHLNQRTILEFKKDLRSHDILVLENLDHILHSKTTIIDEFFHIFNHFYENGKQMAFSASLPSSAFKLKESMQSRLMSGLEVQINDPDPILCSRFIEDKLHRLNLDLEVSFVNKLKKHKIKSVRELDSLINRIYFLIQKGININNLEQLKQASLDIIGSTNDPFYNIDLIVDIVCETYNITREQILSNSRKAEFTLPRHVAMFLAVEYSDLNKSAIARYFKKSDHTTVINAEKNINRRIQKEKGFQKKLMLIVHNMGIRCG